jgi:hypothetical protein
LTSGLITFFVRNNSVDPDTLLIGEPHAGETWADVTPPLVAVVPQPTLAISPAGSTAILYWPTNATTNYFLIPNDDLAPDRTKWAIVLNSVSTSGSNYNVTAALLGSTRCCSLIRTNQPKTDHPDFSREL